MLLLICLNEAKLAVVPFYAFGAAKNSPWYRLSVGTCKKEEIPEMFSQLKKHCKNYQYLTDASDYAKLKKDLQDRSLLS